MVEKIIDPVDPALIEQELTPERFLRRTNKADNVIYVVDAKCAPHTMREIGRLREISFRASGGGTGKACDIDEFDLMAPPCRQLLVWNPHKREIIGAYRFIAGNDIKTNADGSPRIAMGHMFRFSPAFMRDYLPVTIELGRSFVRPEYQSTQHRDERQPVEAAQRVVAHKDVAPLAGHVVAAHQGGRDLQVAQGGIGSLHAARLGRHVLQDGVSADGESVAETLVAEQHLLEAGVNIQVLHAA